VGRQLIPRPPDNKNATKNATMTMGTVGIAQEKCDLLFHLLYVLSFKGVLVPHTWPNGSSEGGQGAHEAVGNYSESIQVTKSAAQPEPEFTIFYSICRFIEAVLTRASGVTSRAQTWRPLMRIQIIN
jgi:hypothetical protein